MGMRIGELAKMAGCQVVTIRFYEKEGLLAKPERDKANYRLYSEADIARLRFILHCRQHGIGLEDIRKLLAFHANPNPDCAFIHELVAEKLAWVEAQLQSLLTLKGELEALARKTCAKPGPCAILRELEAADDCPCCVNCNFTNRSS